MVEFYTRPLAVVGISALSFSIWARRPTDSGDKPARDGAPIPVFARSKIISSMCQGFAISTIMTVQMLLLEGDKLLRLESFGEDTCELISTIEHSFGIKFTEDELIHAKTLGAMARTIYNKSGHPVGPHCLSAITFYQLRRAFAELFAVRRAEISPATSLHVLMPWKTRKKQWRNIQDYLNYALPQLRWPLWLLGLALVLTGSILSVLLNLKVLWAMAAASVLVGIVGFLSVLVLVCVVLSPLAREFPRGCLTFGDLTKLVLARNYGNIAPKHGSSSEKELMQALLHLVAAETSVDIKKLSANTRFPEDLGIY